MEGWQRQCCQSSVGSHHVGLTIVGLLMEGRPLSGVWWVVVPFDHLTGQSGSQASLSNREPEFTLMHDRLPGWA